MCCVVPPQPWTDIPCIWTRSITFKWWPLSIYVELISMIHGINTSILVFTLSHSPFTSSRYLLPSKLSHPWATSLAYSQHYHYHVCVSMGDLAWSCSSYPSGDKVWNAVESKTMD